MTDEVPAAIIESIRRDVIEELKDDFRIVVRDVFREELHAIGLRAASADEVDQAREDFRALRRWRLAMDGIASKIGYTVITVLVGAMLIVAWAGVRVHVLRP
ncbi:hypothetical protein FHS55_002099 [Angulomicrobium tetraedrale]|uniref:Uncharacterized protein n=1 Tax=Ancylobacter tetraedralis TaxID=217068 RepID=A0A839Z9T7_9HYPH|nr:hypothetical protein [Ancylobacter tetraedralis]MBB3771500.1 hypothetical protein [Ancylobacter tetraedralis]